MFKKVGEGITISEEVKIIRWRNGCGRKDINIRQGPVADVVVGNRPIMLEFGLVVLAKMSRGLCKMDPLYQKSSY